MLNARKKNHQLASALAVAASLLAADVALSSQVIEEVIVTARKREENLQEVPMAIAAFGAQQLRNSLVDDITDLQKMTPNITINETSGLVAGVPQIFIRGIGTDPGFDQGVGIYVDDVYLNTSAGALLEVYDVERIEVLKGPQGNLYGRNTIGGAVRYVTREPGDELEAGVELQVGTDELVRLKGNVSGPLIENVLFGGAAFSVRQRDGFQTNAFDGDEWADSDVQSFRGSLLWQATDALAIKFVADQSNDESKPGIPNRVAVNAPGILGISARLTGANAIYGPGTAILDTPSDVSLASDVDTVNTAHLNPGFNVVEIETTSASGTIKWDINDVVALKSITAYRETSNPRGFDFDGSDQLFINTNSYQKNEDFSQEFQFNFTTDTVDAVAGIYYLDGSYEIDKPGITYQGTRLRFFSDHLKTTWRDDRNVESRSAYANVDWRVAEQWQLSLGGRYTEDEKEVDVAGTVEETFYPFAISRTPAGFDILGIRAGQEAFVQTQPQFLGWQVNTLAQTLINSGTPMDPVISNPRISRVTTVSYEERILSEDKWEEFSPSAKITYFANDDLMLYAGFSSGFKAGGFATTGSTSRAYDPEIVESYTLGFKSQMCDSSVRLNGEFFFNDYQDKQLSTVYIAENGALVSTQDNVGKVESWGGELELTWLTPVEGLMLNLNAGYLDSEIKEYVQAGAGGVIEDISDDRVLGYSPEWTAQARVSYDFDIASAGSMLISADVAYRDEMYTDSPIDINSEFRTQALTPDLTTFNAVVAFTTSDEKWRFALDGRNLSDERELVNTYTVSNFMTGGYTRERTWAVSVGYTY
jgi:iron complex outermembrane recepter protein